MAEHSEVYESREKVENTSINKPTIISPKSRSWEHFVSSMKYSLFLMYQRKTPLIGLVILLALLLIAIFAAQIAPYEVDDFAGPPLSDPSFEYLFGTDPLGQDMFSRVIWGTRISLIIAVFAVGLSMSVGVTLGLMAGYFGWFVDNAIMRCMDVIMALPYVLLAILIATVLGPSLQNAILAIALVRIPRFARITRASTLSVREQQYVEAARAIGASHSRIIIKEILPNIVGPLTVYATLTLGEAILGVAVLSFLGLGSQPPTPEWGAMLNDAQKYITFAPHLSIFPGVAIFITVLGFNLFGDGLRDILDPKSRR